MKAFFKELSQLFEKYHLSVELFFALVMSISIFYSTIESVDDLIKINNTLLSEGLRSGFKGIQDSSAIMFFLGSLATVLSLVIALATYQVSKLKAELQNAKNTVNFYEANMSTDEANRLKALKAQNEEN